MNFISEKHEQNFNVLNNEIAINDNYWKTLKYLISGNDTLFNNRKSLIDYEGEAIHTPKFFDNQFSSGERKILFLAFNLFTDQEKFIYDGHEYLFAPSELFSGIDNETLELMLNAVVIKNR